MISKILVALDGSERADGVFRGAAELAASLGASLHLLSAVAVPPEFPPAAYTSHVDGLPAYLVTQAEAHLHALALRARHMRVEVIVRESTQPWRAIIEVADEIGADLIVVGSHGYHGVDYLLGTNAGKVANQARRNVLVVHRPPEPPAEGGYRRAAMPHGAT
jgi:nucleotide-binding universal stress UspA family protein